MRAMDMYVMRIFATRTVLHCDTCALIVQLVLFTCCGVCVYMHAHDVCSMYYVCVHVTYVACMSCNMYKMS